MTAEWAELDARAWRIYRGTHRLLLRLAGQLPDEPLAELRSILGGRGELIRLPDAVTVAAAERGVPLTVAELQTLRDLLAALGGVDEPMGADRVPISDITPATGHTFGPASPEVPQAVPAGIDLTDGVPGELADLEDELFDITDQLVVDALSERPGTMSVRRAWRSGPEGPHRVYLSEVEPESRAWEHTVAGQTELVQMGEKDPSVEVYWSEEPLPAYHEAALAAAALLWRRD
ncbi:hypothetical protein [Nonomuraea longicatena]|uniref:Uncharacterized protein n=1 Tax=Nonomuraea longicatena TaxID=83682 RepID=A0ABP3ZP08_9ACTN